VHSSPLMCDVNNDGLLDVAVATYAGEVRTPAEGERQTERVEGLTESQQVRERERETRAQEGVVLTYSDEKASNRNDSRFRVRPLTRSFRDARRFPSTRL
jgi:hypothetical protein